jgi:hypothetical protein
VTDTQRFAAGEVLPPINGAARFPSTNPNEHLDYIATLLDDIFRLPGTRIRFGLDAIIGWVPGIGDAIAGLASLLIILLAGNGDPRRAGQPRGANVGLEIELGAAGLMYLVSLFRHRSSGTGKCLNEQLCTVSPR